MCQLDGKVIRTIGDALTGTEKPFLITSGTALFPNEKIVTEKEVYADNPHPRIKTENTADEVASKGVKVAVIRLSPSVHGKGEVIGFVQNMIISLRKPKKSSPSPPYRSARSLMNWVLNIHNHSVNFSRQKQTFHHGNSDSRLTKNTTAKLVYN